MARLLIVVTIMAFLNGCAQKEPKTAFERFQDSVKDSWESGKEYTVEKYKDIKEWFEISWIIRRLLSACEILLSRIEKKLKQ